MRVKRGGACTSTADCVTGEGKAGQCVTSADCASRVPYCSKLGYCHGGRLPFDEAQIEIPDGDKEGEEPAQGFVNNNPRKNNPALKTSSGQSSGGGGPKPRPSQGPTRTAPMSLKTSSAASTNPQGSNTRTKPKQSPANSGGMFLHL
ncbi:uncharacterized protein LOC111701586 [Eurytemora carolleeae]|uniref:uncharacterized protein LOC111701586 n=1 Tax=Eurytemora carolleeae TaxID=1294199 RepID=UPI000C75E804|nr:uncharacterized protein LOC111701586 [Eurytemora carolleeae]|eukprot:XP_023328701.1 uncharacterized protein LOC111701586 [Eurytemora affinis]